jgi:hypothetical protein
LIRARDVDAADPCKHWCRQRCPRWQSYCVDLRRAREKVLPRAGFDRLHHRNTVLSLILKLILTTLTAWTNPSAAMVCCVTVDLPDVDNLDWARRLLCVPGRVISGARPIRSSRRSRAGDNVSPDFRRDLAYGVSQGCFSFKWLCRQQHIEIARKKSAYFARRERCLRAPCREMLARYKALWAFVGRPGVMF